jgi:hypothetical protein
VRALVSVSVQWTRLFVCLFVCPPWSSVGTAEDACPMYSPDYG